MRYILYQNFSGTMAPPCSGWDTGMSSTICVSVTHRQNIINSTIFILSDTHRLNIRRFNIDQIVFKSMTRTQTNSNIINIDMYYEFRGLFMEGHIQFLKFSSTFQEGRLVNGLLNLPGVTTST